MYTPEPFQIHDEKEIHEFIRTYPFAALTSQYKGKIIATHLPIDRLKDGNYYGHLARTNPQAHTDISEEVCLIFTGPHAYISPDYYASNFNVPTWNYSAVHAYGTLHFIDDDDRTWHLLKDQVLRHEGEKGWQLPDEPKFRELIQYIRFFQFDITHIEAKFKFNQNKSSEDVQSVIKALYTLKDEESASFMKKQQHQS